MNYLHAIMDGVRIVKSFDPPLIIAHERSELRLCHDSDDRRVRITLWRGEHKLYEQLFPLHQVSAYGMNLSLDWKEEDFP